MPSVYLDYQATTPCDPRVVEEMLPFFTGAFGNAHSTSHKFGWDAERAVEAARQSIANIIHADPKDIIFTSGATESNNLALQGVARFYKDKGNHIITCVTEHKCVLNACRQLESEGFRVTYMPVLPNGLIDINLLSDSITPQTILISIMTVNNEIGVVQPVHDIGAMCRTRGIFFHTDAAQALGKVCLDVDAMNVDLMSISGHKAYGPKGIGALYVRRKPRVRIKPIVHGGGQERGLRSGTLPVPLCVGFGKACSIISAEFDQECARIQGLSTRFYKSLLAQLPHIYLNGDVHNRVPHNLNISFAGIEGEGLMMKLKGLAVSSGSACTSSTLQPSYVLKALGVADSLIHTSLRFGFGRFTTCEEIDYASSAIVEATNILRQMSPLWDMINEGVDLQKVHWHGV